MIWVNYDLFETNKLIVHSKFAWLRWWNFSWKLIRRTSMLKLENEILILGYLLQFYIVWFFSLISNMVKKFENFDVNIWVTLPESWQNLTKFVTEKSAFSTESVVCDGIFDRNSWLEFHWSKLTFWPTRHEFWPMFATD